MSVAADGVSGALPEKLNANEMTPKAGLWVQFTQSPMGSVRRVQSPDRVYLTRRPCVCTYSTVTSVTFPWTTASYTRIQNPWYGLHEAGNGLIQHWVKLGPYF